MNEKESISSGKVQHEGDTGYPKARVLKERDQVSARLKAAISQSRSFSRILLSYRGEWMRLPL